MKIEIGGLVEGIRAALDRGIATSGPPPRWPGVAIEFAEDRVTGVRVVEERKSRRPLLKAVVSRDLPPGALVVSLTKPHIQDDEPVRKALASVLEALEPPDARISVVLPDDAARVALLSFNALPRTRRELGELVRFRMLKALPFKPEDAVMDFMLASSSPGTVPGAAGASVLAVFTARAVVEQYEALFTARGLAPGLVGLSSLELCNLFRARLDEGRPEEKDTVLVNVTTGFLALLVFRGADLIFYRCRPAPAAADDGLQEIRREIYTSLAFYQEKLLGRGIGRALVRACGTASEGAVLEAVTAEIGCAAERLEPLLAVPAAEGVRVDAPAALRVAPAAGAAAGRRP